MMSWRHWKKVLLMSALLGFTSAVMAADAPPTSIYFWNSGGSSDEYVKGPASWGNGAYSPSRRVRFDTLETLQVTTRNLREGVRFDMKKPVDIEPFMSGNGYLRLRVQFHVTGQANFGELGGWGRGGRFRGAPLMQPQTRAAAQLPPFGNAPVAPGMDFNPVPAGPPRESTKIDNFQLTLMLEHGTLSTLVSVPKQRNSEEMVDVRRANADNNGWILFLVPMKSLKSTPGASGNLQRIILTSDNEDTFYLSQLAMVIPGDKMGVSIRRPSDPIGTQIGELTVKPGRLTLVADVEPGSGDPQISWSFDADNANRAPVANQPQGFPGMEGEIFGEQPQVPAGPPVDARGLVASHIYPNQEQNYRVEVTVHDRTGKNPDVKSSMMIRVRNGS